MWRYQNVKLAALKLWSGEQLKASFATPVKKVIHLSSRYARTFNQISGINIGGVAIPPTQAARDLGVVIDNHLKLNKHVNNVCKSASLAIKNIGKIRNYLTQADCERLVHAFDSCNSVLYGLPDTELNKLQRIQNTTARLVTKSKISEHITPVLRGLHWLSTFLLSYFYWHLRLFTVRLPLIQLKL